MSSEKQEHITSVGGQAVMEGVMMRGPKGVAIAVRKPDGEIIVENRSISSAKDKFPLLKLPLFRGCLSFVESLVIGMKALTFSAEFADIEDEGEPSKFEQYLDRKFGDKLKSVIIGFSVVIALAFSIGLFMLLPSALVSALNGFELPNWVRATLDGVVRMTIFITYLFLVSKAKDIQRVFQYHGAEHKTIAAYEAGEEELKPETVKKYSRLHPRCGTAFLLIVMVVSTITFSFLRWNNIALLLLSRIVLLPFVAGVSYEIIKWAGRSKSGLVKLVTYPGYALQLLTTNEPDDSQLEVAIASLKAVITDNKEDDKW